MNKFNIIAAAFILVFTSEIAFSEEQDFVGLFNESKSMEEKGLALASEYKKRDEGFKDMTSNMEMLLKNRHGAETTRKVRIKIFEMKNDGDKNMSIFDSPLDVKGTAFLTFSHREGPDDQWLYLPALKRVKRISSNNRSGSFMGSEFSYEDIASDEVEKYTYKYIEEGKLEGKQVFIYERYPTYKNSGYTRQVVYMDKERYIPLKVVSYDRKNSLLKTLLFKKYHLFLGRFWRAGQFYMENHQTGKSTILKWKTIKFQNGFKESDFSKNALKRVR